MAPLNLENGSERAAKMQLYLGYTLYILSQWVLAGREGPWLARCHCTSSDVLPDCILTKGKAFFKYSWSGEAVGNTAQGRDVVAVSWKALIVSAGRA